MSKRLMYLLLAVSIGLNLGVLGATLVHRVVLSPQGPPPGPGGGTHDPDPPPDPAQLVEEHVRGITRHLDLDAGQQQAIRAVLERHALRLIELRIEATVAARHLSDAFGAPDFDPERFQLLTAETSAARSRVDSLSALMLVGEAAVLTPEQREKFASVAPSIHSQPQRPLRQDGPPPHGGAPPPREGR